MNTQAVAVILLSFVLAAGFLLVILSCALWANWLPLLVGTSHSSQSLTVGSACLGSDNGPLSGRRADMYSPDVRARTCT